MNEMCILELLIDVENFKAICKNSRVISLTTTVLCIYLMAIIFKESSSFKVLCNIEAFLCVKKGLLLSNKQSLEVLVDFFFFTFYNDLRVYPAGLFMERFFTTLFCIEYATKLY